MHARKERLMGIEGRRAAVFENAERKIQHLLMQYIHRWQVH